LQIREFDLYCVIDITIYLVVLVENGIGHTPFISEVQIGY
jgi:hypothetical protein